MTTLSLPNAILATAFGSILFSKAFHAFVRSFGACWFFPQQVEEQQKNEHWTDHLVNILIHSFHVVWITIFSVVVAIVHYESKEENYLTAFPFLFLSSFYMHEFSVRHMTMDVILHHLLFPLLFLYALQDSKTRLVDLYAALEIGHMFHFLPYLLYKRGNSLQTVLIAAKVGTVLFFVIRVMGVIGVTIFILVCTTEYQDSALGVQIFLGICVPAMALLQVYFWWDLVANQSTIHRKITKQLESRMKDLEAQAGASFVSHTSADKENSTTPQATTHSC